MFNYYITVSMIIIITAKSKKETIPSLSIAILQQIRYICTNNNPKRV